MGTALKILTIFVFILSVLAFVLGLANFNKRELLIGRTHLLEDSVIKLANTLETAEPEFDGVPSHIDWDIEEPTDRPADDPETDEFWSTYEDKLEASSDSYLNLRAKEQQLASYYKIGADGKPIKDPVRGGYVTTGAGTMSELLDGTINRAKEQLALLNKTRNQLSELRKKLDEVAEMLNEQKRLRRENLATITAKNGEIQTLNDTVAQKDTEIARLNREKDELNDQIASLNETIAKKDQDIQDFTTENARLKEEVKKLTIDNGSGLKRNSVGGGAASGDAVVALKPGLKGKVKKANPEYGFIIVEFTPEASQELLAGGAFQPVEMMVYRKGADGADQIVTRIRVTNPPNDKNVAIADNMYGWEQTPVQTGDDVIY